MLDLMLAFVCTSLQPVKKCKRADETVRRTRGVVAAEGGTVHRSVWSAMHSIACGGCDDGEY